MSTACVPNIGPRQRRLRIGFGVALGAITLVVTLGVFGASRPWRLVVFFPAMMSAVGILQARAHTCVALAHRGTRDLDHGIEAVDDAAVLATMRRQAADVLRTATIVAAVFTAIVVALPS